MADRKSITNLNSWGLPCPPPPHFSLNIYYCVNPPVREYEKILTNVGSVSTRSNRPLRLQGKSATASVPVRSSNTTENLANSVISTTAADFSTYTSNCGLRTFDLDAPQRYSFLPLPETNRAKDQTINGVIATSTADFRSVSPTANPCTFIIRAPLRYNNSSPTVFYKIPIWNDNSTHEAQMSMGNNRYGLLTTSIAKSPATASEQIVINLFNDHHRTKSHSHEQQRNGLFDNEQRQVTNHATSLSTTAINYSLK